MFGIGKNVDVSKISKDMDEDKAVLVDVRSDGEWNESHAKGAVHLSVDNIMSGELPTNDKKKKIYVYCASGGRASMAASRLKKQGFEVENIGGLSNWQSGGGETQ